MSSQLKFFYFKENYARSFRRARQYVTCSITVYWCIKYTLHIAPLIFLCCLFGVTITFSNTMRCAFIICPRFLRFPNSVGTSSTFKFFPIAQHGSLPCMVFEFLRSCTYILFHRMMFVF